MKEKLQEYALLAEIISALAIVISLVFVGFQIRDNTIASEAASYQASVAYDVNNLLAYGASPETAHVFSAYIYSEQDDLNTAEVEQARFLISAAIRGFENQFIQYKAGMLSQLGWEAREPLLSGYVKTPGFGKFLNSPNAANFGGPFMEYAKQIRSDSSSM